jgi:hypothetical protein
VPGWTRELVVVFEVPEDARLSRFRFALGTPAGLKMAVGHAS